MRAMILLLGGSGYVGAAFARALSERGLEVLAPSRQVLDAADRDQVAAIVAEVKPRFVINAIGYTGRPNIDSTEREKMRCLTENTVVPGILAEVLSERNIPWGHVSSGCIFQGTRPDGTPFTEEDAPNFPFGHPDASWYSRTKAMAEIMLRDHPNCLVWRLRIPFDEFDHPRNYLTKIMRYERLLEVTNTISQLQEFASVSVETLLRGLPGGTYNVTNPGAIRTSEVAEALRRAGLTQREFVFFHDEAEFLSDSAHVRRASCQLSSAKLASLGLPLRPIHEALDWTLRNWKWAR
ncbi:dTDP-4-dehydrorhamnose reductase [Spartobacteria bacterium LR76]|nr:dTDP-4-dehydrorhamnose reductase [Spartobacteria bacterium LR76]